MKQGRGWQPLAGGPSGTHGFFESPTRIAALRAAIGREELPLTLPMQAATDREDGRAFELAPLLRTGVVLAGGHRRYTAERGGHSDRRGGAALDLRGCDLVVLSTCETGLGQAGTG
jgi:hypothetical protein